MSRLSLAQQIALLDEPALLGKLSIHQGLSVFTSTFHQMLTPEMNNAARQYRTPQTP